jgi:hypothetical protein
MGQDSTENHHDNVPELCGDRNNTKDTGLRFDYKSRRFLEKVPLHWLGLNTFDKNGN